MTSIDSGKASANPAPLLPLYFAMMSMGMGLSMMGALMPMLGRELGLDQIIFGLPFTDATWEPKELAITMVSAMSALVFFFAAPFWGRRSDRVGRKRTILTGMVGYGVGAFFLCALIYLGLAGVVHGTTLFFLLLLLRGAQIFVMAATQPSASAYVVDSVPLHQRVRGMSRLGAANQLGTMIGPAFAWFAFISFLAPLYLQAALVCLGAYIVWRVMPRSTSHLERSEVPRKLRYNDPRYRIYLLMNVVIFTLLGMVQQTLGFYFQDLLQLGRVEAAQMFSLAMVCSATATLFMQLVVVQHLKGSPLRLLKIGLPLFFVAFVILTTAQQAMALYIALFILGAGMGLAGPGVAVTATFTVQASEQGGLAGLMASFTGLGFVLGPLLGGLVYRFDMTYPSLTAAILVLPVIVFAWRMKAPEH
jgi:DHA1 family multidrug resistance protein-like MFS transporter